MASTINILASISNLLFYISPYSIFLLLFFKKMELENISSFTILCALIRATLCFTFENQNEDNFLSFCYVICVILCFFWFVIYLFLYKEAKKNKSKYIIYISTIGNIIFELFFIENDIISSSNKNEDTFDKKKMIEYTATIFEILMYISPGLNFVKFVTELNHKYICLAINITGLLNAFVYLFIGYNSKKYYLIISNGISMALCVFFIVFYIIYKDKKSENNLFGDKKFKESLNSVENRTNEEDKKRKTKKQKKQNEEVLDFL